MVSSGSVCGVPGGESAWLMELKSHYYNKIQVLSRQSLDTVQGALDALGLDDRHRGIVVAHADTDSPHVHVLVSRVYPERDGP